MATTKNTVQREGAKLMRFSYVPNIEFREMKVDVYNGSLHASAYDLFPSGNETFVLRKNGATAYLYLASAEVYEDAVRIREEILADTTA